ncbi:MAG: 30S ribosomal protein S17 [Aquificae bacterium]|nr:30S ribosomal protein S17 [Aquificota bacterium]
MTQQKEKKWHEKRKHLVGVVVSDKMDKTVVVRVDRKVPHPLYGKHIVKSKKYHAHDEHNECRVGDIVVIRETRPLSKTKRWVVVKILQRARRPEEEIAKQQEAKEEK